MKSYGSYTPPETVGLNFQRFGIPHGKSMPRAPVTGELFLLEADLPAGSRPWYASGVYVFNGFDWVRIDNPRARHSAPIGAQKYEVEKPVDVTLIPKINTGIQLANLSIIPSCRRGSISGTAIFTVEHEQDCQMLTTVFRDKKPVGFVVSELQSYKSQHICLSFLDDPATRSPVPYTLEIALSKTGFVEINQTTTHTYDGFSQTAFIIEENTK
jgi:hypothetical protein